MKNITFRVDASNQIGTGHFMRCLTLADTLRKRGAKIKFLSRYILEHLKEMLAVRNYEFTKLVGCNNDKNSNDLPHSSWLGTSQYFDALETVQILTGKTCDWLVVDHYALDFHWESKLRQVVKNIFVIDDLADRQHDCDLLLDQNFYTDINIRYINKVPPECQLFLGPKYSLLRKEFLKLQHKVKIRTGHVKRFLIFLSGVDLNNYTGLSIQALAKCDIPGLHVDVAIGMNHPYRNKIETECVQYGFFCHTQTNQMAELMFKADVAIGGGGIANWERCFIGLPTIVLILAENQRKSIEALDAAGIVVNLGDATQVTTQKLSSAIITLIADEDKRRKMSIESMKLVTPTRYNDIVEKLMNLND